MTTVQTFWMEPTDQIAVGLRRYTIGDGGFDCAHGHHHALVYTGTEPAEYEEREGGRTVRINGAAEADHDDPRWPQTCEQLCGYEFTEGDRWQRWTELLYRRTDTGELRVLHAGAPAPDAPSAEPGACWNAWWMPFGRGVDGIYLMVRCPDGHDWAVDSRASNCTLPDDDTHRCWVRHGDPRDCRVTVDKNGITCAAGAGSIATPNWHGFLHDGQLVA